MLEMRYCTGIVNVTVRTLLGDVRSQERISRFDALAGVSQPKFYKPAEGLAPAVSKTRHTDWLRWFENEVESRYEATGGGLEVIADILLDCFEDPMYRSWLLTDEVTDTGFSDLLAATGEHKGHLKRCFEILAARMGVRNPDIVAAGAVLVIEKAILWARQTGDLKETETARLLLRCLQHA